MVNKKLIQALGASLVCAVHGILVADETVVASTNWTHASNVLTEIRDDGLQGWVFVTAQSGNIFTLKSVTTKGSHYDFSLLDGEQNVNKVKVTKFSASLFKGDLDLTEIKAPKTLNTLEGWVFQNCSNLTTVVMSNLTKLGNETFRSCTSLTKIHFPSLPATAQSAFVGCKSLVELELPQTYQISQYSLNGCSLLEKLVLPQVTFIGNTSFKGSPQLKSLKLPLCTAKFEKKGLSNSSLTNLFVHRESLLADLGDATIKTTSGKTSGMEIIYYGGMTNVDEKADWVYDDVVWDDDAGVWSLQTNNFEVSIVAMTNETYVAHEVVEIPKKLPIEFVSKNANDETVTNIVRAAVTAIEACAFKNKTALVGETVIVPKSVTRIGVAAFPKGCYIKVKAGAHAADLVAKLEAEYGKDSNDVYYASVDESDGGFRIIIR